MTPGEELRLRILEREKKRAGREKFGFLNNTTFWVGMVFWGFPIILVTLMAILPGHTSLFGLLLVVNWAILGTLSLLGMMNEFVGGINSRLGVLIAVAVAIAVLALVIWSGNAAGRDYYEPPRICGPLGIEC